MRMLLFVGVILAVMGTVTAAPSCADGPMYWCESCATVKQCSYLLKDMLKVCIKIGVLSEGDCPDLQASLSEYDASTEPASSVPRTVNPADLSEGPTTGEMVTPPTEPAETEKPAETMETEKPAETMETTQVPAKMETTLPPRTDSPVESSSETPLDTITEQPLETEPPVYYVARSSKVCSVFGRGAGYVSTFGQKTYGFQGECTYVIAMDCGRTRDWLIYGTFAPCENGGKCLKGLTLFYQGAHLLLDRGWTVSYRGSVIKLALNYPVYFYQYQLNFDGTNLRVLMPNDIMIDWNGLNAAHITVPTTGESCGLCGPLRADGVKTRNNQVADTYLDVVDSWKVDRMGICSDATEAQIGTPPTVCGTRPRNVGTIYCQSLFTKASGGACANRRWFEKRCVSDWCDLASTSEQALELQAECEVLDAYFRSCGNEMERERLRCPTANEVQEYTLLENIAPWHEGYDGMRA